jgi:predicted transcriptional regulator of viral defense system
LRPVRRGAYVLSDATGGARANLLDLIAALTPHPYLVSGGRALQFHEITDQHFRRADVLVATQLRSWSWRGDEVRYARTDRPLRGHATRTRKTHAWIATPERAIADSLSHPAWGVTLSQVVEALDAMLNRDPTFSDRLAGEVAAANRNALARRLGFLVSNLRDIDAARGFLPLRGHSKAATPLLARGPADGTVDRVWRVRINADPAVLLQHRQVM